MQVLEELLTERQSTEQNETGPHKAKPVANEADVSRSEAVQLA